MEREWRYLWDVSKRGLEQIDEQQSGREEREKGLRLTSESNLFEEAAFEFRVFSRAVKCARRSRRKLERGEARISISSPTCRERNDDKTVKAAPLDGRRMIKRY